MDWSLVLASQAIDAVIDRSEEGWGLIVAAADYERARESLQLYRVENRGWGWKQPLPGSDLVFHLGAAVWAAALGGFYYWTMVAFPQLQDAGMMEGKAVQNGQWWRLFTAVTLHENLPHLAANAVTGFLLLGLAMARYGPGLGVLAAFVAGAMGNAADWLVYPETSRSLGASGMVMGALGLLSVHSFSLWRKYKGRRRLLARGAMAGFLILVLLGFGPGTDVVAHVGGFAAGALIGLGLSQARPAVLQRGDINIAAELALAVLLTASWCEAARHS